ncbi:hybrid sensor histidine kinase/response regulator [filamentous cyanobacterium CCP5]|nr:hybrid sensor histidine kinase/response regulator [filamentous cyanobacterium CCP5]
MTDSPRPYRADILAIDDTPENLQLLSQLLSDRQYKVRSVTKGKAALRAAQAAPPDLVLLDINMPEMGGYEVCQRLKADDRTRQIPVIFISALGETLDKVKGFQVGGVDFVTKPFQVEEVLARIETHLQICFLQRQLQEKNQQLQQEIRDRQRAEEIFTKAFRASPSPILITTLDEGRCLEANPSFLRLSGYGREEVIGHRLSDLNLWLDADHFAKALKELQQAEVLHNREFELHTKAGQRRTVLLSVELIELQGHRCALTIANDITQRQRLESEFISLVSHELKTPMHALIGALDLLSTGQLGCFTDQGQQMIAVAINNAERLVRLVNDVLDLERMKSGTLTLHPRDCHLPDLFDQARSVMQAMAATAQVELVVEPVEVNLRVDGDRLQQLLTNLLSNAIKFSAPGGSVWLTAELVSPADSPSGQPGTAVHIMVSDRGRGIPADMLDVIFNRFQQVDASDARNQGGTGLGLSICRQIVQQHQGRIWAESELGEGSRFHVVLPIVLPIAVVPAPGDSSP